MEKRGKNRIFFGGGKVRRDFGAEVPKNLGGLCISAHGEDDQSFPFHAQAQPERSFLRWIEKLLEAARQPVLAPLGVGQAPGAHLLGLFLVGVERLSAEGPRGLAGEEQGPHAALAPARAEKRKRGKKS